MKNSEALKTIGEVSKIVEVPIYVLRFWERKINLISPIQKKNGMRYYDKYQITLIENLKNLLYKKSIQLKVLINNYLKRCYILMKRKK